MGRREIRQEVAYLNRERKGTGQEYWRITLEETRPFTHSSHPRFNGSILFWSFKFWVTEKLYDLPKVNQLFNGRTYYPLMTMNPLLFPSGSVAFAFVLSSNMSQYIWGYHSPFEFMWQGPGQLPSIQIHLSIFEWVFFFIICFFSRKTKNDSVLIPVSLEMLHISSPKLAFIFSTSAFSLAS